MALTHNVPIREAHPPSKRNVPVAASTHIYHGMLCGRDSSGNLVELATSGLVDPMVALQEVDNSNGQAGDLHCECQTGVFSFKNDAASNDVGEDDIGDVCYGKDGETVSTLATSRSVAGIVVGLDGDRVLVYCTPWPLTVGLLAASNLSDVGTPATARANILSNRMSFTFHVEDLKNANQVGFVCPTLPAGSGGFVIDSIKSVLLRHALATGDATLTAKINASAITTGVITITESGSAIGDVDTCSPSAARTAVAGDWVNVTVGGTNSDTSASAMVTVSGTY